MVVGSVSDEILEVPAGHYLKTLHGPRICQALGKISDGKKHQETSRKKIMTSHDDLSTVSQFHSFTSAGSRETLV